MKVLHLISGGDVGGAKTHGCGSALDYTREKARTGEGARREGAVLHGASLH